MGASHALSKPRARRMGWLFVTHCVVSLEHCGAYETRRSDIPSKPGATTGGVWSCIRPHTRLRAPIASAGLNDARRWGDRCWVICGSATFYSLSSPVDSGTTSQRRGAWCFEIWAE